MIIGLGTDGSKVWGPGLMLESQAGSQSCAGAGCETEVSSSRLLVQHCWNWCWRGCAKSHSDRFLVGLVL